MADEDDFLKELRDLRLPEGGGDLAGALDRVDDIIARAKHDFPRLTNAEVYFLTDLGTTKWDAALPTGDRQIRQHLVKLAESARLAVADLASAIAKAWLLPAFERCKPGNWSTPPSLRSRLPRKCEFRQSAALGRSRTAGRFRACRATVAESPIKPQ